MAQTLGMQKTEEWNVVWTKWFHQYSRSLPRIGMWLHHNYGCRCRTFLEIAAGSTRESKYLARFAEQVYCIDYAPTVVELVAGTELPRNLSVKVMDAFHLEFPDRAFECTFHKGFWIYFDSDEDLARLLREQVRVTSKFALALVHNVRNHRMVADFAERAKTDPLFNVRFYDPNWLESFATQCLANAGAAGSVRIRKYGGVGWINRWCWPESLRWLRDRLATVAYASLPWSKVESIVLEILLSP